MNIHKSQNGNSNSLGRESPDLKVAVIGAGPAGMTAAYELTKAGINVEVFEASNSVGGLAKSMTLVICCIL